MTDFTAFLEAVTAALLLASAGLSLIAALGLLRLRDFFQRMHAPALTTTLGTWCAALAAMIDFSMVGPSFDLRATVVIILMALTAPITTLLLARATLFRQRSSIFLDQQQPSPAKQGAAVVTSEGERDV
jgi:multicomponent K+:H+ antiporter subunit G